MISLYKYMSMPLLLKFMKDPCLRITPSHCQNDPFEFGYSKQDIDALNAMAPERNIGTSIKEFANRHGCISLSSDYQDVCMWSHYADNHKGAVVEILVDELNPFSSFWFPEFVNRRPYSDLLFGAVNYVSGRSLQDATVTQSVEIRRHYYFTKSERWSQENEYRYVVPFDAVDKIICTKAAVDRFTAKARISNDLFHPVPNSENLFEVPRIRIEQMTMDPRNFAILELLWGLSQGNDVLFFSRLSRGCPGYSQGSIGAIYFGVNADLTEFMTELEDCGDDSIYDNYVNLLNHDLRDLYQATIDTNNYQLQFSEISKKLSAPDF